MRRGIITLIPKKDKDQLLLKNWRPISLLNTDYKILTKVLAYRIKKILPDIIHNDQSGFINGRYIGENIRLFIDVFNYFRDNNIPGLVLGIDFEKAFDKVEWDFLYMVMEKFGFNIDFIRWIRLLYTDIEGCVINNGFSSDVFSIECGVRQGCPLSPYLFIIVAEILALIIRQDNQFKGLSFENSDLKICQYADDTLLFLQPNECNLRHCFHILHQFNHMSGLKINIEKCNAIRLGSFNGVLCPDIPLAWPAEKFLYLGINIPLNRQHSFYEMNFYPKLKEIEKILQIWSLRNLTFYGKITIIKTLIIPKLIYLFSILPNPPDSFFSEMQKRLFKFVWNNKGDRIKRSILYNDYSNGGLNMPHLSSFNNALKVAWVKRFLDDKNSSNWKISLSKILEKVGGNCFFKWNLNSKDIFFGNLKDGFWRDVLLSWSFYKYYNPVRFKEIISQPLWFNSLIKANNNTLFIRNLHEAGLNFIGDICNVDGSFLRYEDILNGFCYVPFLKYYSLISAIPQEWKASIKNRENEEDIKTYIDERLNLFLQAKKTTKLSYRIFVKDYCEFIDDLNLRNKWQKDLEEILENPETWNSRFSLIYKSSVDTNIRSFQYKFLHRIISTNEFLFKIGVKSSPLCNFCDTHPQTMVHLFLKCVFVISFWNDLNVWLTQIKIRRVYLSDVEICFGVTLSNNLSLINTIVLHAKKYIFSCNYWNRRPHFLCFKQDLVRLEKIERCIAFRKNLLSFHTKKWNPILSISVR